MELINKLSKWVPSGLLLVIVIGVFNFYVEWKSDEAAEDAEKGKERQLMFDSPEQKQEHNTHVREALPALEQRLKVERDADFQKQVLKELKENGKRDTLFIDQIYIMNERLTKIENHQ